MLSPYIDPSAILLKGEVLSERLPIGPLLLGKGNEFLGGCSKIVKRVHQSWVVPFLFFQRVALLLKEYPLGRRIVRRDTPLQVTCGVGYLGKEVLKDLCFLSQILRHVRWKHFLFDKEALSGISRGLGLDHVVWTNSPGLLQV